MPARRVVAARIWSWGQDRNGGRLRRVSDACPRVLIVEVESELRLDGLNRFAKRSSFRCRESTGVAVDIDALSVVALDGLGAVRIEHRNEVKRAVRKKVFGLGRGRLLEQIVSQ